jgi:hypothetical protein
LGKCRECDERIEEADLDEHIHVDELSHPEGNDVEHTSSVDRRLWRSRPV